jgi:hypothetical protein
LTTVAVLTWLIKDEIRLTASLRSPGLQAQYRANLRQFNCLTKAAHQEVPKGARVYLGALSVDYQRLSEYLVGWAQIAPNGPGIWKVTVTPEGQCPGGIVAVRT